MILDPRILQLLVVGQQFLPRPCEVLVGSKRGDKRAEREIALDDQIATDGEEEERCNLGDEVVEEFDEELLAIDVQADAINLAKA